MLGWSLSRRNGLPPRRIQWKWSWLLRDIKPELSCGLAKWSSWWITQTRRIGMLLNLANLEWSLHSEWVPHNGNFSTRICASNQKGKNQSFEGNRLPSYLLQRQRQKGYCRHHSTYASRCCRLVWQWVHNHVSEESWWDGWRRLVCRNEFRNHQLRGKTWYHEIHVWRGMEYLGIDGNRVPIDRWEIGQSWLRQPAWGKPYMHFLISK